MGYVGRIDIEMEKAFELETMLPTIHCGYQSKIITSTTLTGTQLAQILPSPGITNYRRECNLESEVYRLI